jgi:hypothetical protein
MTKLRRDGLELQKMKMKLFVRFSLPAFEFDTVRLMSRSILRGESVIVLVPSDISKCLLVFVRRYVSLPVPRNCESQFMETAARNSKLHFFTRLCDLSQHLPGHLRLIIMSHALDDPFPVYLDRDSGCFMSILSGCYVTPYVYTLFRWNADLIDGLLMDATWKII